MATELLTPNQAADRLQVHLMTIYKWISSGRLEAKRLPGGGLRIEVTELEKLLTENKRVKSCRKKKL